jgi:hypothetical protein
VSHLNLCLFSCEKESDYPPKIEDGLIFYMLFYRNVIDYSPGVNNGIDHTSDKFAFGKWGLAKVFKLP